MLSPSVRITAALACACTLAACGSDGPTGPAGFTTAAHAAFPTLSERLNAALSGPRAGEDVDHGWAVGVYIP